MADVWGLGHIEKLGGVASGDDSAARVILARRWAAMMGAVIVIGLFVAQIAERPQGDGRPARPPGAVTTLTPSPAEAPPSVEAPRLLDMAPDEARRINQAQPFVTRDPIPALPLRWAGNATGLDRAVDCLAAAAWYEAGDDPVGERAVIQVVINRLRHPAFPASICGVVFQGSERTTGCQFTFTCDGSLARIPAPLAWARARQLAHDAIAGTVDKTIGLATHYHTDWVVPYWSGSLDKIARVGAHLFYRWPGYWGTLGAFRKAAFDDEPLEPKLRQISPAHRLEPAGDGPKPALAPTPLPAPIILEGVREKSLRSSLVRAKEDQSNTFFIQVDPDIFPGNYATAALAICKGRNSCHVFGWQDPSTMALALPLADGQARTLSFYFSHDDAHGDKAFWDCLHFKRSDQAQCLPGAASAIEALATATS